MYAGWMDDLPKQAAAFIYNCSRLHQSCQKSSPTPTKTPITTCLAEPSPDFTHSSSLWESGHVRALALPANQQRLINDPGVYFMYHQTPSTRPDLK